MAKNKPSENPATPSPSYERMIESWEKIETVLGGTKALREAATRYTPKHDNESDASYHDRLNSATLLNLSKLILESWTGRPFSKPMVLREDVPQEIRDMQDNIDLLGNGIPVFARNWFREGLAKGLSHTLIEMPRNEGGERTLADDRDEGVRPYWVDIAPEQLFFADSVVIDGEEVLTEVRIIEEVTVRDGFAMSVVEQIRQLELADGVVVVTLWRKPDPRKDEWAKRDEFTMDTDRIPLVTFYADRDGLMEGMPPLEDIVDLNIAHFQSTSDQRNALTVARFPIITVTGGTDENKLVIGPKKWLYAPDPQAKFSYLEHSGQAIETGRRDLQDLEAQMANYGSEFLKRRPGRETATARALDSEESTSALQDATLRFQDALQTALAITAKWMDLPEGGTVDINTQFAPSPMEGEGLRTLIEARKLRDVSRKALLMALKEARVLPEDFDIDGETEELENEVLFLGQGALGGAFDAGAEDEDGGQGPEA